MTAYYNEINEHAAETLRELIRRGIIAPGEVDTRSIEDVRPDDLRPFRQCHFFAGAGVWSYALRNAGWSDDRAVWTGSCPCQPFSAAGKGDGFADERHLWPAWFHLIEQSRPECVYGEQVASHDGLDWLDLVYADMEGAGYAFGPVDTCAAGFGAPHIRQRLYFAAFALVNAAGGRHERGNAGEQISAKYAALSGRENKGRWWHDLANDGAFCKLGDAIGERLEGFAGHELRTGGRPGATGSTPTPGVAGGMDNAERNGWRARGNGDHAGHDRLIADAANSHGELADTAGDRRGRKGQAGQIEERRQPRPGIDGELSVGFEGHGAVDGLADTILLNGSLAGGGARHNGESRGRIEGASETAGRGSFMRPGPVNGHWRDADWLYCTDGKWRPVEPGASPLAHGAAARVGRLRLYGNGLVEAQARGFIQATKDFKTTTERK